MSIPRATSIVMGSSLAVSLESQCQLSLSFSVSVALHWCGSGWVVCGPLRRTGDRHKGGGAAEKNYRLDNRANIKEMQALNRQVGKLRSVRSSCIIPFISRYFEV